MDKAVANKCHVSAPAASLATRINALCSGNTIRDIITATVSVAANAVVAGKGCSPDEARDILVELITSGTIVRSDPLS